MWFVIISKRLFRRRIEKAEKVGYDEGVARGYIMGYNMGQVEYGNRMVARGIEELRLRANPLMVNEIEQILKDSGF